MKNFRCSAVGFGNFKVLEREGRFVFQRGSVEKAWERAVSEKVKINYEEKDIAIEDLNEKRNQDRKDVQRVLAALNFNPGPIDGIKGPKTKSALRSFKKSFNERLQSKLDTAASEECDVYEKLQVNEKLDGATIRALEIYTIWQGTGQELAGVREGVERTSLQKGMIGKDAVDMREVLSFKKRQAVMNQLKTKNPTKYNEILSGKNIYKGWWVNQNPALYAYLKSLPVERLAELLEREDVTASLEAKRETRADRAVEKVVSARETLEENEKKLMEIMDTLYGDGSLYDVAQKNLDGDGFIKPAAFLSGLLHLVGRRFDRRTESFVEKSLKDKIDIEKFEDQKENIRNGMRELGVRTSEKAPWLRDISLLAFGYLPLVDIRTNILTGLAETSDIETATQFLNYISSGENEPFVPEKKYGPGISDMIETGRRDTERLLASATEAQKYGREEHFRRTQYELEDAEQLKRAEIDKFIGRFGNSAETASKVLFSFWERTNFLFFEGENREEYQCVTDLLEKVYDDNVDLDERVSAVNEIYGHLKTERAEDTGDIEKYMNIWKKESVEDLDLGAIDGNRVFATWDSEKEEFIYRSGRGKNANRYYYSKLPDAIRNFETKDNWKEYVKKERKDVDKDKAMKAPKRWQILSNEYHRQITRLANRISQLDQNIEVNRLASVLNQFPTMVDVAIRYPISGEADQDSMRNLLDSWKTPDLSWEKLGQLLDAPGVREWLEAIQSPETYEIYYRKILAPGFKRGTELEEVKVENKYAHGKKVEEGTTYEDLASQSPDGKIATAEYILRGIAESHQDYPLYLTQPDFSESFHNRRLVAVSSLPEYVQNRSRQSWNREKMKKLKDEKIWGMKHEKKYQIIDKDGKTHEISINYKLYLRPDCANVVTVPGSVSFEGKEMPLKPLEFPTEEYLRETLHIPLGIQVWGGIIGLLRGGGEEPLIPKPPSRIFKKPRPMEFKG